MSKPETDLAGTEDWASWEPVQFSTSIQPHGLLLVLSASEYKILQVSANVNDYLGIQPQTLLGQSFNTLVTPQFIEAIRQSLIEVDTIGSIKLPVQTATGTNWFTGRVHQMHPVVLLELEPADAIAETSFLNPYAQVKQSITRLHKAPSLAEFLQAATEEVRQITGFDRTLIYQFDSQEAGAVVAEAKQEDLSPYLGLHYPATDIPQPVREWYKRSLLRYIPNLTAPSIQLVPLSNPIMHQPVDLTLVMLRGVDPCCIEYHQNMGVAAILVMALIYDQTLWGLISCHHHTPKRISHDTQVAVELLGQFIESELGSRISSEELWYIAKLKSLQSEFVASISEAKDLKDALVSPAPRLLGLVNAGGAAVCLGNEITLIGKTPLVEQIRHLIQWAEKSVEDSLFYTNSLPKLYPPAIALRETASGLLLLQISKVQQYYILWFRPEVLQTVNWAGNPNDSVQVETDGSVTLSPRKSFEHWQETVRLTALPWKAGELENALNLRSAIVGIVLKKADELAQVNQELERSNQELDSFAYAASHDLKEPLRGIHNYATLLLKGYANVLDDSGKSRLQTLIRLVRRMELLIDVLLKFSRLGQTELNLQPTDLNQLVNQTIEDLLTGHQDVRAQIRIPRSLPIVDCDPVLITEMFTNLLSNALKYNEKEEQWVEIGFVEQEPESRESGETRRHGDTGTRGELKTQNSKLKTQIFYVRDNGIGIRERHFETIFRLFKRLHEQQLYGGGTGAGLTIAKKIVERHGGRIWVESTYGEGTTIYFTL